MHCIVLPLIFDGGLSISILKNEQLFTKNWGFKTEQFSKSLNLQTFQIPPFGKRTEGNIRDSQCFGSQLHQKSPDFQIFWGESGLSNYLKLRR
jgi:hypothetical protein